MAKTVGKLDGLNRRQCQVLDDIGEMQLERNTILNRELAQAMLTISEEIKREIAVFVERSGRIALVSVGQMDKTDVYDLRKKRWKDGYAGVSCIHTHPSGHYHFSEADLSALKALKYDAMLAITQREATISVSVAFLQPKEGQLDDGIILMKEGLSWEMFETLPLGKLVLEQEATLVRRKEVDTGAQSERAILIIQPDGRQKEQADIMREELVELAHTAGLEVVEVVTQPRRQHQNRLGTGKLEELAMLVQNVDADIVVFDQSLTPSYNQLLSDALRVKVIDKTLLILDIFAQRAWSKEGKLQVELAQLNYFLPRLVGMGTALSRLGGGVGTRGPGETQLETDRRHIRRRIHHIREELALIKKNRALHHAGRSDFKGLKVALVGYTNAGKSSLLNALADDESYVMDQLFATLDPVTRNFQLDNKKEILISDTVGFIRELPPQLLDAFKATLEELQYADVLLHVVDISKNGIEERIQVVEDILQTLSLSDKIHILVCNKVDLCDEIPIFSCSDTYHERCFISCHTGWGIDELKKILEELSSRQTVVLDVSFPYGLEQGQKTALAHKVGEVLEEHYSDTGVELKIQLSVEDAEKYFREFMPKKLEW